MERGQRVIALLRCVMFHALCTIETRLRGLVSAAFCGAVVVLFSATSSAYAQSHRAGFEIAFQSVTTDLPVISTTLMPGERLSIRTDALASSQTGQLRETSAGWDWTAPQSSGLNKLQFERNGTEITLNVFVLTPWKNGETTELNGYKIGRYSSTPFRGLSTYRAPTGFIDVTDELRSMRVSPHFTLGQFLCKQQPGHDPTYVLIQTATLLKLEAVLEEVVDAGFDVDTLHVMSGFRTPWYNASIGNRTTSSRHLFGGAADVFVDADKDGWMDDLNGDGEIDRKDAEFLASLAEGLADDGEPVWSPGGIGVYAANAYRGPFVHIDARGYRARW